MQRHRSFDVPSDCSETTVMDGSCAADVARRTMRVAVATTQHHWDRLRRCDHAGYSPPCGACEGVGVIASSDTASDIKIVSCKIEASTVNPLRPIWEGPFTELASHEILIGEEERVSVLERWTPWSKRLSWRQLFNGTPS